MVPAVEIFAHAIECLRMKLFEQLDKDKTVLSQDDILYVLTVPAIWDDAAKDFMRKAAITVRVPNFPLERRLHSAVVKLLPLLTTGREFYPGLF